MNNKPDHIALKWSPDMTDFDTLKVSTIVKVSATVGF